MRFKNSLAILLILIFIGVTTLTMVSAEACTDTNEIDISDIPCEGLTNIINCVGIANVTLTNLNTTEIQNLSTQEIGDGRLNFTFNFTEGSYSLVDCENNTATIIVGDFPRDDLWRTAIMIGMIGMAFTFITLGKISFRPENWILKTFLYIVGGLLILISVQTGLIFSRVDGLNTMMTTSLVISITSLSVFFMYILIYYTLGIIRASKSKNIEEI